MGKIKLGGLKLQWSKEGIAYKFGGGAVKRFYFSRQHEEEPQDEFDAIEYEDGVYDEYGYDEYGGYEYGGYDDGYDDSDEYYDDADAEEDGGGGYSIFYQNEWLVWLLLVVLPPLGIYLLWKQRMLEPKKRLISSGVASVWCIVLLVLLFTLPGGRKDPTAPNVTITQPATSAKPVVAPEDAEGDLTISLGDTEDDGFADADDGFGDAQDASAPADAAEGPLDPSVTYVYSANTGAYYHSNPDCEAAEGDLSRIDLTIARSTRNQSPCPTCYGESSVGTTYYVVDGGKYYHINQTCSDMKNARATTKAAAIKAGFTVCPKCIGIYYMTQNGKYYHKTSTCSGMRNAVNTTAEKAKAAGKTPCPVCAGKVASDTAGSAASGYYSTPTGKYYHANKNCSGMKNATKITAAVAKQRKQTACPICIGKKASASSSEKSYYATTGGEYYHTKSNCSGMKNATKISLETAKKYKKKPCPKCVSQGSSSSSSVPETSLTYYYATASGKYYHKTSTCSGMKGAKKITLATALKNGKTKCPRCLSGTSNTAVFATTGGRYYHSKSTCSGMKNPIAVTLAKAKAAGKTACPVCYGSKTSKAKTVPSTAKLYATANGRYYHTKSTCSGMKNAKRITLATAQKYGKTACPVCASGVVAASQTTTTSKVYCYATKSGKYYHKKSTCSGMTNASKIPLATAKKAGKVACPVCVTGTAVATTAADKGTTCYIFPGNGFFHAKSSCSGLTDGKKTTVNAAKRKGYTVCPVCAGNKLSTYVWVEALGLKYHASKTCREITSTPTKVSLATALERAYKRCPVCDAPSAS
ncbi:MAG: hypothetical protein ACOYI8_10260 [Christensenellales bacterium]|jgi:hypothetical protein